jgi:hypothetical protein
MQAREGSLMTKNTVSLRQKGEKQKIQWFKEGDK